MATLVALKWIPVFKWHGASAQQSTLLGSARLGADRDIAALKAGTGDATQWNEEARALMSGLILQIVATEPLGTPFAAHAAGIPHIASSGFSALLTAMQILHDIRQLRHLYGERAGTFLANAGLLQVFGVNDHDTAVLGSKMIGEETVEYRSEGWTTNQGKNLFAGSTRGSSVSEHVTAPRPFTPDKNIRLGSDRQLLLRPGQAPLLTGRIVYFRDREFSGLYDPA